MIWTGHYKLKTNHISEEFDYKTDVNMFIDIDTKRAALKASESVVSLATLTGIYLLRYCVSMLICAYGYIYIHTQTPGKTMCKTRG